MDVLATPPVKPLMRGVLHQVFFFVALAAGALLVAAAPGGEAKLACAVYGVSLATMLGVSALYHRPTWGAEARQRMRRLDHSAIFVLIAGTYTPMALTLPSHAAKVLLTVSWVGAAIGVVRALFWIRAPKWVAAVLAVTMGWLGALYLPGVAHAAGYPVLILVGVGGALYTLGALIYAFRRPDPWPKVFGYHEVFHALVVAAAVCHFAAVVLALPAMAG